MRRTEGMTPAAISKIVDTAALDVFREATATGKRLELDTTHLLTAIERYGGQDRPTVEHWTWESLVLSPRRAFRQLHAERGAGEVVVEVDRQQTGRQGQWSSAGKTAKRCGDVV